MGRTIETPVILAIAILALLCSPVIAGNITLVSGTRAPYRYPRPGNGWVNVPLRTSIYFEMKGAGTATVIPSSVTLQLDPVNGPPIDLLLLNKQFAPGCSGKLASRAAANGSVTLTVYVDRSTPLLPLTTYTLRATALATDGGTFAGGAALWTFVTAPDESAHSLQFDLNIGATPVKWTGGFFSGYCQPGFCSIEAFDNIPTYDLMDQVRQRFPKAWSLQRDWRISAFDLTYADNGLVDGWFVVAPNVVRELETRHITSMTLGATEVTIQALDFFGHEQYGIPSGRPLSADYHPGDEVLIADGHIDARAFVVSVDDGDSTVRLTTFPTTGWQMNYVGQLPTQENPEAPGLFPPGGTYLRKFNPTGTPRYYWGRVDKQYDAVVNQYNRRLIFNICEASGDLSNTGRNSSTAKDYAELHQVTYDMADHMLDRYGSKCLNFLWSIGNEWNLGGFWEGDWADAQKFYDYTVDAILHAFEDHGYDSNKVVVGGLEMAGSGTSYNELRQFFAHFSPTATYPGALPQNQAYIDPRLNGKRSSRVETLCAAHGGKGTPIDFYSRHLYWDSAYAAQLLIGDKAIALEIDPVHYEKLAIHTHESCPNWSPPPDMAAKDSYLSNGYFVTWCSDVARRLLAQASLDPRYGYGDSVLTFWPWPQGNFVGGNGATQMVGVDEDGDGDQDSRVAIGLDILGFLGLLSDMGNDFVVLPQQVYADHIISGFAGVGKNGLRLLIYAHNIFDTQARSEDEFDVTVNLSGVTMPVALVEEYRFDKNHNSAFHRMAELRERVPLLLSPAEVAEIQSLAALRSTARQEPQVNPDGSMALNLRVSANGANYVMFSPPLAKVSTKWMMY